jgi:hypothetical protein
LTDCADDRLRSRRGFREEHLCRPLFGELAQPAVKLLALQRIGRDRSGEMLGAKRGSELERAVTAKVSRCASSRGP